MSRPKDNGYPAYLTWDAERGGLVVRNPLTGKKKRFPPEKEADARKVAIKVGELVEKERQAGLLDAGKPKIIGLIDAWKRDRLPFMPWDTDTRKAHLWRIDRIGRELGDRHVARTDCVFLAEWMDFCKTADQWNNWRYEFFLLWEYAVSKKLAESNEGAKILDRSTSKKLEINRKVRQPLDVEGFLLIYDKSPGFLRVAMDQSLVTLQGRTEVCSIQHAHYRGGYLYTIREKTSGESDMAFIRIEMTDELEAIRRRSLTLDDTMSPFLVHRKPDRMRRQWTEGKPHWTYVNPSYLSKAFEEARDHVDRFKVMTPRTRPTFHEVRGLGSRLQKERGREAKGIQMLMAHKDPRATKIYLEGGAAALSDQDYTVVSAPFTRAELLG